MPTVTWSLPSSPAPPSAPAPTGSSPSRPTRTIGGIFDQYLDPVTGDYVDTDDGAWWETEDSRTAVLMQLTIRYGEWWVDPEAGSRLPGMLEADDGAPVTVPQAVDETRRALQALVDDGIITDLLVITDPAGDGALHRGVILISYRDRASGRPVDGVYQPFAMAA